MPVGDLLPEIIVLLAAVTALVCASFLHRARQSLCCLIANLGLVGAGAAVASQLASPARLTFSGVWAIDGVSAWGRLIIVAAALLITLLAPEWFSRDRRHGEYYAVLLFATLGAMLMAGAADTMQLVMGVLLSSVTGYTLAAYHRDRDLSLEAGMKFFLVGAFANSLLLIGVVWLFGLSGSTDYRVVVAAVATGGDAAAWLAAAALVVVGLAFKLGAVPAHTWMPDVAQGAPAPSAAYLTVVPKIGAAVALVRLSEVFAGALAGWQALIMALAVASMTLGNLAALRQADLRRLLGWSSVSQSGYALVAIALVGSADAALPALLVFLAAYAAANVAAFAVVVELRGRSAIADYRGLVSSRPGMVAVLTVALLSLVGIPPLAGFVGKLLLMLAAIDAGHAWLAAVVVANTIVSLFYYLRVLGPAYFDAAPLPAALLGRCAYTAVWASGLLVIGVGVGAGVLLELIGKPSLLP